MARIIGDEDAKTANKLLDKAEMYLKTRGTENARIWYLIGSSITAIIYLIILCIIGFYRSDITNSYNLDTFEIIFGTLIGGLGAVFFIFTRSNKIIMDPAAGAFIHYVESASRVFAGSLGALLIALAINANVILGIIKYSDYSFPLLLTLCFCAGASERFVSGIIKKIENISKTDGR